MTSQARWVEIAERHARATKGPWSTEKPVATQLDGFASGMIIAATGPRQAIYADPPGGSFPAADRDFIAHSWGDVQWLLAELSRLTAQVAQLQTERNEALCLAEGPSTLLDLARGSVERGFEIVSLTAQVEELRAAAEPVLQQIMHGVGGRLFPVTVTVHGYATGSVDYEITVQQIAALRDALADRPGVSREEGK